MVANQRLIVYAFKEFSERHGKVCYTMYYPVAMMSYTRVTMHDIHVNNILNNLAKERNKYQIKIGKPSNEFIVRQADHYGT